MKKVTLKQVAEAAGVSPAAVSLLINHKKRFSRETSERISKVIRELHYRHSSNRKTIVFIRDCQIATSPVNYLMRSAAMRIECHRRGWRCVEVEESDFDIFNEFRVDGAVIFTYFQKTCKSFSSFTNVPIISFSAPPSHVNNVYGVHCVQHQQVVEYFLGLGHTRIGCIVPATVEEINLWRNVKEKLHLETLFLVPAKEPELCQAAGELLRKDITAMHVQNYGDRMPRILALFGKKIPQDISLTIGDTPTAAYLDPALTTFAMDYEAAARAVADGFEKIWSGEQITCDFEIPGLIIERESCLPFRPIERKRVRQAPAEH